MADTFAPMPVKTKVAGDLVINVNAGQTIGLAAGSAVAGKFGIDQTTPGTTNLVTLAANQSVNFTQIGGVAPAVGSGASSAGTQRMILATDQQAIPTTQALAFVTTDSGHLTSVALAAGATITLDGAQIASGTGKLFEATVSSSVAIKAQLGTWDGTTFVVKRTFFIPANATFEYAPTRYDAITMATGVTAKFRWSITNNDNANAADVYASITHAI